VRPRRAAGATPAIDGIGTFEAPSIASGGIEALLFLAESLLRRGA
jgi:hypothetical protein